MKLRNYFLCSALFSTLFLFSQTENDGNIVEVNQPDDFFVTAPMTSYPQVNPESIQKREVPRNGVSSKNNNKVKFINTISKSSSTQDPLVQNEPGSISGKTPIENFDGINLDVSPPDPSAAVGPNHIVQMTNGLWTVYDKNGVEATGFPKDINDPLGGVISGDPVVLYDREADRWFISQFQLPDDNQFKIAVSTTSDPTGSYAVYSYDVVENDYPHYGIWGNSYVVTGNFSPTDSGTFFAFNRQKMLDGDPTAEIATLTLPNYVGTGGFQAPQPVHSEGAGVAAGPAPIVWFQDDAWPGVTVDHVKVWDFDIDWSNPGAATVSTPLEIPLSAFDSFLEGTGGNSFAVLEQPGTTQRIDPIVFAMYFQAHRYNFGTHESILFNFPVEVTDGSRISGIRWVELRRLTSAAPWTLYQEGTYQDAGGESVFLSAIAMDQEGNIGLGYTKTGATTFPSLYYTGRFDDDVLGQMTIAETVIVEGDNSITSNARYGDYSQLVRDPEDDLTFWFTGEYSGEPRKTRIASFKISETLSVDELDAATSNLVIYSSDNNIFNLQLDTQTTSDILKLSVFDISGKKVYQNQVTKEVGGVYLSRIDLSSVSSGTYIVEIGNAKTKLTKKIIVK
ncbi:T9SS type A sorting domain-containing protein [Patiriisocius hiemis]|uniref:T9SS type A sorting domain-containing protein n=1 Tax=Patiriisocius hiemis TaxID=3075604 RepID=A0ABU2YDR1_9FLAO|nr:T9SS type A sorting domain-containing protein [Constantimarinum sp. W242]MDT0556137.1 T9SS type A sorting domain-containing protein [Constantimarinum sp. W242]